MQHSLEEQILLLLLHFFAVYLSGRRWWGVTMGTEPWGQIWQVLKHWDKAPHPGHLGGSFFSLALLVGVVALAARAWSAACQGAQALHLLWGGQYLLATIWLQQKETERRISCKATVKILFSSMPWWEICWLNLLFPQVITVTGLNRYTCIHSAPIISPLSCSKQRDTSLFHALKSCII